MEFLCKSPKAVPRGSIEIGFDIFCDESAAGLSSRCIMPSTMSASKAPPKVYKQGALYRLKRGKLLGGNLERRRWFVLYESEIRFYAELGAVGDGGPREPKGVFALAPGCVVEPCDPPNGAPRGRVHFFVVRGAPDDEDGEGAASRQLLMCADSERDKTLWVEAIRAQCGGDASALGGGDTAPGARGSARDRDQALAQLKSAYDSWADGTLSPSDAAELARLPNDEATGLRWWQWYERETGVARHDPPEDAPAFALARRAAARRAASSLSAASSIDDDGDAAPDDDTAHVRAPPPKPPRRGVAAERVVAPRVVRFDVDLSLPLGVVFEDARDDALVVAAVDAGSPAQQSGVVPGWRMCTLAGEAVDSRAKLEERLLAARDAGEILVVCEFAEDDDCVACGCGALAA